MIECSFFLDLFDLHHLRKCFDYLLSSSPMCSSMSMLKEGLRVMWGTSSKDSSPTTVSWTNGYDDDDENMIHDEVLEPGEVVEQGRTNSSGLSARRFLQHLIELTWQSLFDLIMIKSWRQFCFFTGRWWPDPTVTRPSRETLRQIAKTLIMMMIRMMMIMKTEWQR